jgi:hypothetical protein
MEALFIYERLKIKRKKMKEIDKICQPNQELSKRNRLARLILMLFR